MDAEPQCRDVPETDLRPGECPIQTEYGNARLPRYCGAPIEDYVDMCDYHAENG